jgi:hypothetical protein
VKQDSRVEEKRTNSLDGSDDVYGVGSNPMEVDSDVHEDTNRESLLDASMQTFTESIRQTIEEKERITNVPKDSVFEGQQ